MASTVHKTALATKSITTSRSAILSGDGLLALAVVVCAALLLLAQAAILTTRRDALNLPATGREARVLFAGFNANERDERGRYRWSTGDSTISFPQVGAGAPLGFVLRLGPPPITLPNPPMSISYNNSAPVTIQTVDQPRVYRLLVPANAPSWGKLAIHLQSDSVQVEGDSRRVALRVESAQLRPYGAGIVWPGPLLLAAEFGVLVLLALLLRMLRFQGAAVVLFAATLALVGLSSVQMLLIAPYLQRMVVALTLLVALSYAALPWLVRRLAPLCPAELTRALWGATLLAIIVRVSGALYPIFTAHDLPLNVERLLRTVSGGLLVTNRSFEFSGGVTVYPPGPYLALQPALLLGLPPNLLVAGGIALIDGLGAFAVGLLARTLGLSQRATLLAALLYAGVPVGLMALFFGHTAQAFGQAMTVPLTLLLLHAFQRPNDLRRWLLAALPLSVALLSHIGVTVIAVAWLGLAWLALLLWQRKSWRTLASFTTLVAGCALLALTLIYGTVLGSHLEQTQEIGAEALDEGFAPAYWLIARGFVVAFEGLGLLLAPVGALLLARRTLPTGARALLGAWLVAAACFLGVELITGLQVRYIYFLAPLLWVLVALMLDRLANIGWIGQRVAWIATLLFVLGGWITWYSGVVFAERVSMVALLR